jgi:hypothetical protein
MFHRSMTINTSIKISNTTRSMIEAALVIANTANHPISAIHGRDNPSLSLFTNNTAVQLDQSRH